MKKYFKWRNYSAWIENLNEESFKVSVPTFLVNGSLQSVEIAYDYDVPGNTTENSEKKEITRDEFYLIVISCSEKCGVKINIKDK